MTRTVRISDLDDNYEEACQQLLWYGVKWLRGKPRSIWNPKETEKQLENIKKSGLAERLYGAESDIKQLEELWSEIVPKASKEIINTVKDHLKAIHNFGYYHWINKIGKETPEKVYDLDLNKLKRGAYGELDFGTEGPTIT